MAVWAPMRPKCSASSCSSSMTSPGARFRMRRAGLVDRHLDHRVLDLVHDVTAAIHADLAGPGLDADEDVLLAGDAAIGGLDALFDGADQRLLGNLLLGVELEERTDEVTTHHAPPCSLLARRAPLRHKETWVGHPRSVAASLIGAEYTPGPVDPQSARSASDARGSAFVEDAHRPPICGSGPIPPCRLESRSMHPSTTAAGGAAVSDERETKTSPDEAPPRTRDWVWGLVVVVGWHRSRSGGSDLDPRQPRLGDLLAHSPRRGTEAGHAGSDGLVTGPVARAASAHRHHGSRRIAGRRSPRAAR